MKILKKFNLLANQILQEIQTYNDKPGYPGGNNIKHSDTGSITGNTCKFSTDAGNIGGKTDTCYGLCDQQINYKYDINTPIFIYYQKNNQIYTNNGIIVSRSIKDSEKIYGIRIGYGTTIQYFPEYSLGRKQFCCTKKL